MADIRLYFAWYNDWILYNNYSVFENITDPVEFLDRYAEIYFPKQDVGEGRSTIDITYKLLFGMITPLNINGWAWNTSFVMTSRWNASNGETFGTAAQGFWLYYRQYKAHWLISRSTIKLVSAEAAGSSNLYQPSNVTKTIEFNFSFFQGFFPRLFMDFDWKHLGDIGSTDNYRKDTTPQPKTIKSDTTLVGTMVWARLTTMWGLTNPFFNMTDNVPLGFRIYSSPSTYVKTTPTLKRSKLLAAVLATNPIILLVTLIIRVLFLHDAPISKDFGFASLLAGIDPDSLEIVKGAAYSGKLTRDVRLRFLVSEGDDEFVESQIGAKRTGRVITRLEDSSVQDCSRRTRHDRVKPNVTYL